VNVAIVGLWHLGTVTAAVFAEAGHSIVAVDEPETTQAIDGGRFPVAEPGLAELWDAQRSAGRLRTGSFADIASCEVAWICYDTPLDADDRPAVAFVCDRARRAFEALPVGGTLIVSSQLPVGTLSALAADAKAAGRGDVSFAAIPENLRLGSAIEYLRAPDRFVLGTNDAAALEKTEALLAPLGARIEKMSVESAEMTKHALNAFLATCVVFANEIATISERVGADAREVERGLKTDVRIGPKAYVRAGEAFAGGTLARDLGFLIDLGHGHNIDSLQITATRESNDRHKGWIIETLSSTIGDLTAARIALLGLVYKPGTDTLRSSTAVQLAVDLTAAGAEVAAFDPAIGEPRAELAGLLVPAKSAREALQGATAAVLMTPWPDFRTIGAADWASMRQPILIDPQRFLEDAAPLFETYAAFGRPSSKRPA
jgi:UDPglucose 6-dehydrogenase